jgi:hypothetical protein
MDRRLLLYVLTVFVLPLAALRTDASAHDRAFWVSIARSDYAIPPGEDPYKLIVEMNELVGSTDPVLRDDVAYGAAARWMYRKRLLTAEQQKEVLRMWTANLAKGIGERGTDSVFRRSFSALNLSLVAALDLQAPFLGQDEYDDLLNAALDYLARERDTRGYDAAKGWIHTPAHTADLLKFLARSPKLPLAGQRRALDAIASKASSVDSTFAWGEDERLAQVVRSIVRRGDFDAAAFTTWLAQFPEKYKELWAKAPAIDAAAFPPIQNMKLILRAAFAELSADTDLPPQAQDARALVLKSLQEMQ